MNWQVRRGPLKHLGTLHGTGDLRIADGKQNLGPVVYEIDGYVRRAQRSDTGQIEGPTDMLARAFRAGTASIVLADGQLIDVVLSDPRSGQTAEIRISGRFPRFDHCGAEDGCTAMSPQGR